MKKVFGIGIDPLNENIPEFVQISIEYLKENGLKVEGLFRVSGDTDIILELKKKIDKGKKVDFKEVDNIHNIAGLLKLYFRELPEPLLLYDSYDMWIASSQIPDEQARLLCIKKVLNFLPKGNYILLKELCSFLNLLCNQKENLMTPTSIAVCFAPNLLKPQHSDLKELLLQTPIINSLMETLIKEFHFLFQEKDEKKLLNKKLDLENLENELIQKEKYLEEKKNYLNQLEKDLLNQENLLNLKKEKLQKSNPPPAPIKKQERSQTTFDKKPLFIIDKKQELIESSSSIVSPIPVSSPIKEKKQERSQTTFDKKPIINIDKKQDKPIELEKKKPSMDKPLRSNTVLEQPNLFEKKETSPLEKKKSPFINEKTTIRSNTVLERVNILEKNNK